MGAAIGIDLGTTNTVVAHFDGERVRICDNAEGEQATPSVVAYNADGTLRVGTAAARGEVVAPTRTIRSVKRHMGTDWSATIDANTYTAVDVSAAILAKVAADASDRLGQTVTDAVITVPAYFTDAARQATIDAGEIAGLNVLRIINEPTAAILAYDLERHGTVAVFDVGGGTYDISIVTVDDGIVEVLATAGDARLGGDDLDAVIAALITAGSGADMSDPVVAARINDAARTAKHTLTGASAAPVHLPYLVGTRTWETTVTRSSFDAAAAGIYHRLAGPYRRAVADAGSPPIDQLILVGGSTRVPAVAAVAAKLAGRAGRRDINPDTCVAVGAAISAWQLAGAHMPAVRGGGELVVSSGDAGLAAPGANLPAAADTVLVDVTGHSLGIETNNGDMSVVVRRNTTIPGGAKDIFTTLDDNQTCVVARIFQGEDARVANNVELGSFRLEGLDPAPAGVAQIEVAFTIDADGVLNVSATDLATGASKSITLFGTGAYTEADIDDSRRRLQGQRARTETLAIASAAAGEADALCERAEALCAGNTLDARTVRKLSKLVDKVRAAQRRGRNLTGAVADLRAGLADADGPRALTS